MLRGTIQLKHSSDDLVVVLLVFTEDCANSSNFVPSTIESILDEVGQFLHMVFGLLFQGHVLCCLDLEEEESEQKHWLSLRGRHDKTDW